MALEKQSFIGSYNPMRPYLFKKFDFIDDDIKSYCTVFMT